MRSKFKIIIPACLLLLVVFLAGYFSITSRASDHGTDAMNAQSFDAKDAASPETVQEAQVTAAQVNESEENADSLLETYIDDYTVDEDGIYHTESSGYELNDNERIIVECAVMCEAGGECVEGQMMVAQSILDGSLRNQYNVFQTISKYDIATTSYSLVTDQVRESVSRVFDDGQRITLEKTDLWYNPALVVSIWHEEQQYVITVGSHRFFWMNRDM